MDTILAVLELLQCPEACRKLSGSTLKSVASPAIAAVDAYNRPGPRFRTAQFVILIIIAWTAAFHAIFCRRHRRPWFRRAGVGVRYVRVDGEPKHWDLFSECLKQYFGDRNPAERKNLEFLVGLRNRSSAAPTRPRSRLVWRVPGGTSQPGGPPYSRSSVRGTQWPSNSLSPFSSRR